MPKATWKGAVIAESDDTVVVEGNHYFRPEDVNAEYLRDSDHHTRCFWKGLASYKHIEVDGQLNENAAWYYPEPSAAAAQIAGRFAFWHGVEVS